MKKKFKQIFTDYLLIAIGTFIISIGINVFLAPNKISGGGVTSIGTVLLYLFGVHLSVTNLIINIALFILGYKFLGKSTIIKSVAGILLLSFFLETASHFPAYTGDIIISSLAGGILLGTGLGFVIRRNASTGGSDFAALIIKRFIPHLPVAHVIMFIDCAIIVIAGIAFKSLTVTFYSAISLFTALRVTDAILTMGDTAKTVHIFSSKHEKISGEIIEKFHRGVTGIYSKGMYSDKNSLMLLCVVNPKELPVLINMIRKTDENAFIVINDAKEVLGEGFKLKTHYD